RFESPDGRAACDRLHREQPQAMNVTGAGARFDQHHGNILASVPRRRQCGWSSTRLYFARELNPPLPVKNERGEDRGERNPRKNCPPLPDPLLPRRGEREKTPTR